MAILNKKKRRNSGRITPNSTLFVKKESIITDCLEPQKHYSDWDDFRDSFRGYPDKSKLQSKNMRSARNFNVERWNKKIKKLLMIRKAKKIRFIY